MVFLNGLIQGEKVIMIKSFFFLLSSFLFGVYLTIVVYYNGQKINDPDIDFDEFIDLTIELIKDLLRGNL